MKAKHAITAVLLFFVVGSIAYMIIEERKGSSTPSDPAAENASLQTQSNPPPAENPDRMPARQVTVYYFHGDVRCPPCHKLEDYAREAVETGFAEELGSQMVQWKAVNVDQPQNAHFVKDYQLITKSVILSETVDGKEAAWQNLDKIWDLVGNKDVYMDYIRTSLRNFLKDAHS